MLEFIDEEPRLLRPANFHASTPGRGATVIEDRTGQPVLVLNLQGRVFMDPADSPFDAADRLLAAHEDVVIRFVDFHAEATSEKVGLARYLDGRVSAVVGTHTHVPTADERIQPGGTAAITDAGMTGPFDSIIGVKTDAALRRLVRGLPTRFEPATSDVRLSGVLVSVDRETGRAVDVQRVSRSWEA